MDGDGYYTTRSHRMLQIRAPADVNGPDSVRLPGCAWQPVTDHQHHVGEDLRRGRQSDSEHSLISKVNAKVTKRQIQYYLGKTLKSFSNKVNSQILIPMPGHAISFLSKARPNILLMDA